MSEQTQVAETASTRVKGSLIQTQILGQPQGNQALAQHMLHRLAHAQVGRQ